MGDSRKLWIHDEKPSIGVLQEILEQENRASFQEHLLGESVDSRIER